MKHTCGTCFYGLFERTAAGRVKRNIAGRCTCPGPGPEHFPQSMWEGQCATDPDGNPPVLVRHAVWPNFGRACPKWCPREIESLHSKCFPLGAP